jgi:polysaccharide export outer membrane protein
VRNAKELAILVLLLALPLAAQHTSGQRKKETKPDVSRNSNGNGPLTVSPAYGPAYVIGAEDVLNVSIWKEPDLTRTVPVRPDGKISLPLLDDIQAAGLTPTELATGITERLRKYLTDPQVTVIVTAINSQRIYILGEVIRAGAFPLVPNMTVLQALSSAGGFTQFADQKKIYVLRMENGKQAKYPFNYREVVKGIMPEQNVLLKSGDTIVVP